MLNRATLQALLVAALALIAAVLGAWGKPNHWLVEKSGKLNLEKQIPTRFGDWTQDVAALGVIVNPQQQAVIDSVYSQTLSRTYVNLKGDRVMLSVAYGDDQRDGLQAHRPEVCYPAQGFQVLSNKGSSVSLGGVRVPAKRLETVLGASRHEPVTYWMTVGESVVTSGLEKKLAELRYGLKREIPDGLLFRVSSIDRNAVKAFALQDNFINQIIPAIDHSVRARYGGNGSTMALP